MTIFECDDSIDAIFTAVYDAWASRLGHENVRLQIREQGTLELFAEYREVAADPVKAEKVARTIRTRMGEGAWEQIYRAAMADDGRKADCIYRVLVLGLSPGVSTWESFHVIEQLQEPNVCRVFELARKVGHEAHRYLGFVRFRELENGVLFSDIEPESNVLPLLGDHFADRFPKENFMIYDHSRRDCLLHRACGPWFILLDTPPDLLEEVRLSAGEQEIQRLWKGFCRSISIQARENPVCQRQFWPLKFRKWMTEGQAF